MIFMIPVNFIRHRSDFGQRGPALISSGGLLKSQGRGEVGPLGYVPATYHAPDAPSMGMAEQHESMFS